VTGHNDGRPPGSVFPDGFGALSRDSPFLRRIGPFAIKLDDHRVAGFVVADHHTNARGQLHGGALAAIVDVVMGHATAKLGDPAPALLTASLTINLTAGVTVGQWLTVTALPRRLGRRMAFADATVEADQRLVATASGVFAVMNGQGE
jgi:acyl-coenzyme A thioesterase 13